MNVIPQVILLVFFLYLLVRWERVKRPFCFLFGVAGLLFWMVGWFFTVSPMPGQGLIIVANIFQVIGSLVALMGAVGACFGGDLPVKIPGETPKEG